MTTETSDKLKSLVPDISTILKIGAVIWSAATISAKVTHLDEAVHTLNASMVKVFDELTDVKISEASHDVRLNNLEKPRH